MNARIAIVTAVAERDLAADALATAEAAHAMAVAEAAAADKRIADIVETEQRAASAFAERIRAAVSTGGKLAREKPSPDAVARGAAEADARAAHAAVEMLLAEMETARAALTAAQHGVSLATLGVCAEVGVDIVDTMWAAYETIQRGQAHLADLQNAAFTPMPQPADTGKMGELAVKPKVLNLDQRGLKLLRMDFGSASFRTANTRNEDALRWHDWRKRLVDDPDAPAPWGGQ